MASLDRLRRELAAAGPVPTIEQLVRIRDAARAHVADAEEASARLAESWTARGRRGGRRG